MTPFDESSAPLIDGRTPPPRLPYRPPDLETLGRWSALTLQQSIPIGPGSILDGGIDWPSLDDFPAIDPGQDFLDRILDPRADGAFRP